MRSSVYMMLLRLEQSHMPVSRSDSDTESLACWSILFYRQNAWSISVFWLQHTLFLSWSMCRHSHLAPRVARPDSNAYGWSADWESFITTANTSSGRRPTAGHDCNVRTVWSNFRLYKGWATILSRGKNEATIAMPRMQEMDSFQPAKTDFRVVPLGLNLKLQ